MKLTLFERQKLFEDVESFRFKSDEPLQWEPGQYLHYVFEHAAADERGAERWFTVSTAPYEGYVQITTRFAKPEGSSFKKALRAMKEGDTVQADGPKGKFVITEPAKKHVFVAGGIGITPYRSMLAQLDHDNQDLKIELLYANRDENFVFGGELDQIASRRTNFHIHKFVGGRHIEEADLKPYADDPDTIIYLSGPEPMVEAFEQVVTENLKVSAERVKTDFFPGYPAE